MSAQPKVVEMATPPIIIIKRKAKHAGHHGGAWKVAYADFVTAMMALFIVLWLLNSNPDVRKAIGGYFSDPKGVGKQTGSAIAGTGEAISLDSKDMDKLKEKISQALMRAPDFQKLKNQIDMVVTGEGLRIELLESDKGSFFETGRPLPTPVGRDMIERLAVELGKLPNKITIEGHTDSKPYNSDGSYSNWELSADRANAARRLMQERGVKAGQVTQVRGFADQKLRRSKQPQDPSNRRISVIVQYLTATEDPPKSGTERTKEQSKKPKE